MLAPVFRSIFTSIINNVNNIYPHVPHLALNSLIISRGSLKVTHT